MWHSPIGKFGTDPNPGTHPRKWKDSRSGADWREREDVITRWMKSTGNRFQLKHGRVSTGIFGTHPNAGLHRERVRSRRETRQGERKESAHA